MNTLHEAIDNNKQVCFKYYHYDIRKKKEYVSYGEEIRVSPYALIYRDGTYKLLAIPAGKKEIALYRLEQMEEVRISRAARLHHEIFAAANMDFYTRNTFSESLSNPVPIVLNVHRCLMDDIIERYGIYVKTSVIDEEHFTAEVNEYPSPEFYGWLLSHGGKVKIISPGRMIHQLIIMTRGLASQK